MGIIQNIGPIPLIVVAILAVLIFGTKLPKVARSLGACFIEFKRGLFEGPKEAVKDLGKEIDEAIEGGGKDMEDATPRVAGSNRVGDL